MEPERRGNFTNEIYSELEGQVCNPNSQCRGNLMIFFRSKIQDVYVIELEPQRDERGFFSITWDRQKFEEKGLNCNLAQCGISFNKKKGTIRGMHFQVPPHEETKIVRCTRGKIFDVVIDLRPRSSTYKQWISQELTDQNRRMLYIPQGIAHGFQTLEDDTEIFYQISEFYSPQHSRGVRWNDPAFGIHWPLAMSLISKNDMNFPDFRD